MATEKQDITSSPIMQVTIAKAGPAPFDINMDKINQLDPTIFQFLFVNGLKPTMERGLTKVKSKDLEGDELAKEQAKGREIVLKNLEAIYEGKIRMGSKAAGKLSGKVKVEALRLAKIAIKAAIKANNERIKDYEAKEITALAEQALAEDPTFIQEAEANLAQAETKVANLRTKLPTGKPKAESKKGKAPKAALVAAAAKRARGGEARTQH